MRKLLFLFLSIFSVIILFGCVMPQVRNEQQKEYQEEQPKVVELETKKRGWINDSQPLPIGAVIFRDRYSIILTPEDMKLLNTRNAVWWEHEVTYTYLGLDGNNVRVIFNEKTGPRFPEEKTLPLLLPLNNKKQTILSVKMVPYKPARWTWHYPGNKDLLITVVDEFNRITVEEIAKTQTK